MLAKSKGGIFTLFKQTIDNLIAKEAQIYYIEVPQRLINNSNKSYNITTKGLPGNRGLKSNTEEVGIQPGTDPYMGKQ